MRNREFLRLKQRRLGSLAAYARNNGRSIREFTDIRFGPESHISQEATPPLRTTASTNRVPPDLLKWTKTSIDCAT